MKKIVLEAFQHYLDLPALARSPLAQEPAVLACLESEMQGSLRAVGYAVRALLDFALVELAGSRKVAVRNSHSVLVKRYIERLSKSQYADAEDISEDTARSRQRAAIKRAEGLISAELQTPTAHQWRTDRLWQAWYDDCSAEQQHLLRFAAIFANGMPAELVSDSQTVAQLQKTGCLSPGANSSASSSHCKPRCNKPANALETLQWHKTAAVWFEKHSNTEAAVNHWLHASEDTQAVRLLTQTQPQLPTATLETVLPRITLHRLTADDQAQVHLLNGHLAMQTDNLAAAHQAFRAALTAPDAELKATAYYYLARLFRQTDVDAALAQHAACRRHLTSLQTDSARRLLAQSLIDEAWVFIEQRTDYTNALALLDEAETIERGATDAEWLPVSADRHNALGGLYLKQGDRQTAITHRWQAWQLAQEAGDTSRALKATHNLGSIYVQTNDYAKAREFYETARDLAQRAGNDRMIALNEKGLGHCAFFSDDFACALQHYRTAYELLALLEDRYWQASVCFDLTELLVLIGKAAEARERFVEGRHLAQQAGNDVLLRAFDWLGGEYVEISAENLLPRQRNALNYTRRHQSITNQQYCTLTDIKTRTALNDLNLLVERGFLKRSGQTKGVVYRLAVKSTQET